MLNVVNLLNMIMQTYVEQEVGCVQHRSTSCSTGFEMLNIAASVPALHGAAGGLATERAGAGGADVRGVILQVAADEEGDVGGKGGVAQVAGASLGLFVVVLAH
jgi:hypothetical protein